MNTRRYPTSNWIALAIGGLLTIGLVSGYRPWGDTPANGLFLLGPLILFVAAAGEAARARDPKAAKGAGAASSPGKVAVAGLVLLLVGGCPWLYTPYLYGGRSNESSGMLGTLIFLFIGLPGLAVMLTGLFHMAAQRRARRKQDVSVDFDRALDDLRA